MFGSKRLRGEGSRKKISASEVDRAEGNERRQAAIDRSASGREGGLMGLEVLLIRALYSLI